MNLYRVSLHIEVRYQPPGETVVVEETVRVVADNGDAALRKAKAYVEEVYSPARTILKDMMQVTPIEQVDVV